jgi:hypothetical protein
VESRAFGRTSRANGSQLLCPEAVGRDRRLRVREYALAVAADAVGLWGPPGQKRNISQEKCFP